MSHTGAASPATNRVVIAAIGILAVGYLVAMVSVPGLRGGEISSARAASHGPAHPSYFAVIPFVLLLGAIALLPLIPFTQNWWQSNRSRFVVAAVLAVITLIYYGIVYDAVKVEHVLEHAVLDEYIPFIVLLFSLYAISGGIRIEGDLPAKPLANSIFLAIGGLLASFIGTTGAAMLLIRPLLQTNREREHKQHTVVFFIFVVCNCGGCLLPIGDPPLFLGYLEGVGFLWTTWNLWLPWLVVNAVLIGIYYLWDALLLYPKEDKYHVIWDNTDVKPLKISGLWPNALLLLGVILAVALLATGKKVPGTEWAPWPCLREIAQLVMVALSLAFGSERVRSGNRFNYHAMVEVAVLFFGIFICMQPALEILGVKGKELGVNNPQKAFWATGGLSSALDNAPTYLVFYRTVETDLQFFPHANPKANGDSFAEMVNWEDGDVKPVAHEGTTIPPDQVKDRNERADIMLVGISLGAVFMGAMTYIGNGPNFMVRAIAEQSGVRMPSFFGYVIRYSVPFLLPVFVAATLIFLR